MRTSCRAPEELVALNTTGFSSGADRAFTSYADLQDWKARATAFAEIVRV